MSVAHAIEPAPTAIQRSHSHRVMRQTQAVIGLVVLAGVAAAYLLSPAWLILPAIVGLGLLAAAVTGVCPMAIAIATLPWNRNARDSLDTQSCCALNAASGYREPEPVRTRPD